MKSVVKQTTAFYLVVEQAVMALIDAVLLGDQIQDEISEAHVNISCYMLDFASFAI